MDIVNDVLQPIGLPLVGAYCSIKEDTFLNTSDVDAKGFEGLGNWILTPARFLFNGKEVTQLNFEKETCRVGNQFKYTGGLGTQVLQTTFAIIFLIPSIVIGSAFKGLGLISSESRARHRIISKTTETLENIPEKIAQNKKAYKEIGIKTTYKGAFTNSNPTKKPSLEDINVPKDIKKTLEQQKIDVARLNELGKVLTEAGIVWWADFGTCLGVYRHNGMIPWDEDIDIAILAPDHDVVKHLLLSKLPEDKFDIWDFSPGTKPKSLLKIRIKETNMLVDIYHYTIDDVKGEKGEKDGKEGETAPQKKLTYEFSHINEWWMPEEAKKREPTHSYSPDAIFPLKKANFDGAEVYVPNQIEDYLLEKYSDSEESKKKSKEERIEELKPCRVWDSKKNTYVKVPDHPYFLQSAFNA